MTSKSSFLVNSKENHKRRIWVWIISILVQVLLFPGIMTIYLSRIKSWYEQGAYRSEQIFREAMYDAAKSSVGFQGEFVIHIAILGVLIAVQGFSYLYDRKKVDMYQSVPVPAKKRFLVIYSNGILIYLIPAVIGTVLALFIAAVQGAVNASVITECGIAFILNFLCFLVVYHTAILAVMLTGNVVVTGFAVLTFLFAGYVAALLSGFMRHIFFDTADYFFEGNLGYSLSIVRDYVYNIFLLNKVNSTAGMMEIIIPLCARWVVCAAVIFALAYFCYSRRPAEAAGRAITFPVIKPFVKIIISAIIGVAVYYVVEDASYHNNALSVFAMIIGTVICCCVMEAIYEFDIRCALKHIASTGVAAGAVIVIFCSYRFDIFGYDKYVPDADKVESVAVNIGPYQNYWEWMEREEYFVPVRDADYLRENMFLTDVDAVCELARKGQGMERGVYRNERSISVLYRLKSGREVYRCFLVDCDDASNEELLNRVIGTKEYREGYYLVFKDGIPFEDLMKQFQLTYSNGAISCELPAADIGKLRDAWVKDMEDYDFTLAKNNRICGNMLWELKGRYNTIELPVYESFANTISLLQEYDAYYPVELRAEDIAKIEVTNHNYEEILQEEVAVSSADEILAAGAQEAVDVDMEDREVTKSYEDPQEIEAIIAAIYPESLDVYWSDQSVFERDYNVVISFKSDAVLSYGRGYYYYRFLLGQVPDFVVQQTAYGSGQ